VHRQVGDLHHHQHVEREAAIERQRQAAVAPRLLVDDELEQQVGGRRDATLAPRLLDQIEREQHGRALPLVVARAAPIDNAALDARREVGRDDVDVGIERQRAPPLPRHAQDEVGPARVRLGGR